MISVKISQRKNSTIKSVCCQGNLNKNVDLAAATLMMACGKELESIKSGLIEISSEEMIFINDIKQSRPAVVVADALIIGLENLKKQFPYNVNILYLWENE